MARRIALRPTDAGVVYSPNGASWAFYPEERLFVGTTGTPEAPTHVRSMLWFPAWQLDPAATPLRAVLRLRLVANEPPGVSKTICVREPPSGTWDYEKERAQPTLAQRHVVSEGRADLEFDVTGTVVAWWRGAQNRGLILDFARPVLGLVTFALGRERPGPRLRLVVAGPSPRGRAVHIEAGPDGTADAAPPAEPPIENGGPGSIHAGSIRA